MTPRSPAIGQTRGAGDPAPASLVYQQKVSSQLDRQHDCFGLARVQILAEILYTLLVIGGCYYQPRLRRKVDRRREIALGTD